MNSVEIQGDGPPLLMLHGWGQNLNALTPLGELLTSVATPYLVDLPGFGGSEMPPADWSAKEYAEFLVQTLIEKKIRKFSLLGHSFGGKVAIHIALRHPEMVEKLVLIAPSGLKPKRSLSARFKSEGIKYFGKGVKTFDRLFGTAYFANAFVPRYGSRDYKSAAKMRNILVKSVNEDLTDELPKVAVKTLILWGEKDTETPLEAGFRFSKLIPEAQMKSFAFHDHELFQDVGAHLAATYIVPFLKEGRQ